jgi:hypothetical protein
VYPSSLCLVDYIGHHQWVKLVLNTTFNTIFLSHIWVKWVILRQVNLPVVQAYPTRGAEIILILMPPLWIELLFSNLVIMPRYFSVKSMLMTLVYWIHR